MSKLYFNTCLIKPADYPHSLGLEDALKYIHITIQSLGYVCEASINHINLSAINIIFGAHLLDMETMKTLPKDTIIFNSEQLVNDKSGRLFSSAYLYLLEHHRVWDYSEENLKHISHPGKSVIKFGYCEALKSPVLASRRRDYILFYGSMTQRRKSILEKLSSNHLPVKAIFGSYSFERDLELCGAAAVLNLHKSDRTAIFEPIRCFYPLINDIPVLTEDSIDMGDYANFAESLGLFEDLEALEGAGKLQVRIVELVNRAENRVKHFKKHNMRDYIQAAIQAIA